MRTTFETFDEALGYFERCMSYSPHRIRRGKWQGVDVSTKPEMEAFELHHVTMKVPVMLNDLHSLRREIRPNLPWADNHFAERIGGNPLNPGIEWKNWPWGDNAGKFRIDPKDVDDPGTEPIFDHTYSQRYWPKFAGQFPGGIIPREDMTALIDHDLHQGIYYPYGDLNDVVWELKEDPTTRQAILPVFFPEDTGYRPGRRKPCSLFYHFMRTGNSMDISYQLRSCDMIRHLRDDIYLTVRLLLWIIDRLRELDSQWHTVTPGLFVMQIANLHVFVNDMAKLKEKTNASKPIQSQ